jgi:hypothetical protein
MLRSRHEQHGELGINLMDKRMAVGSSIEFQRMDAGEIFRAQV